MKYGSKRSGSQTLLFALLTLLTCAAAVGIVLLSGNEDVKSSAGVSGEVSSPQASSGSSSLPMVSSSASSELGGALSAAAESAGSASSREYANPSVSSPKSNVIPGSADLSFTPEEQESLDALLQSYGGHVSVYFQDIASGAVYEYDADRHYFVASLIKAPYSMYLYHLAEQGKCDLNELLTVEEEDKQEGTGSLKDREDLPQDFTVRELISFAIRESDNTAMKVLLRRFPSGGFRDYAVGIGIGHADDIKYVVNGQIDAREAGIYLQELYRYIENGKYGGELKADMLGTSYYMIQSGYPVARKYGWTAGEGKEAYHDMAIVYAPHPYLLAICTDHQDGKAEDRALFGEISTRLEKLWTEKYLAAPAE